MFWFREKDIYVRRPMQNRRRGGREPILMVNARVTEQRRQRAQKVGAAVLVTLAVTALAWLLAMGSQILRRVLFTENARFTIHALDFETSPGGRIPAERLREYTAVRTGENLFAVDIRRVCSDLEKVPLVERVEVRRKLPDTLVVSVSERVALARLGQDDQRFHLAVDRQGHVLGPSSRSPNLPAIVGKDQPLRPGDRIEDPAVRDALTVLDLCDTTRLGEAIKIKSIDVRHPERLNLFLSRGEHIEMGRDQIEWRLGRVARAVQEAADAGKVIRYGDFTVDKNNPVTYQ